MKKQHGFAIVEVLLFLIFAALVVGVGWFVWQSNNKSNDSLDSAATANSGSPRFIQDYETCVNLKGSVDKDAVPITCTTTGGKKFEDPNPTAGWKDYSNKTGKYSLKYPEGWGAKI